MCFFDLDIRESVTIAKPIDDVFRLVARWDLLLPRIDRDVISCEKVTPGAVGVGTRYREVLRTGPMKTVIEAELTAVVRPTSYDYDAGAQTLDGGGEMTCESVAGGTKFSVHLHGRPRRLGWILIPLLQKKMSAAERVRLANLKRMMESGELSAPADALD